MEDELRLLRQAHEEQAKHVIAERMVVADRIRALEMHVEHLEREVAETVAREHEKATQHVEAAQATVADAEAMVAREHELASRHVDAARAERDAAVRRLEEFEQTGTYRLVLLMHRVLSRRPDRSR
jgi:hypothetical protein